MTRQVECTVYAQIRPRRYYPEGPVMSATVERATGAKPRQPLGGTQLVKLTIRVPVSIFDPLTPEAIITIPESLIVGTPITVEAVDPR